MKTNDDITTGNEPKLKKTTARRKLIKSLAAGSIVGVSLPEKWSQPIINSVLLPAHAQTTTGGPQFAGIILNGIVSTEPPTRTNTGDLIDFFVSPAYALDDLDGSCVQLSSPSGTLFSNDTLKYEIIMGGTLYSGSTTVSGNFYSGTLGDGSISFKHVRNKDNSSVVDAIFCVITDGSKIYSAYCPGGSGKVFRCTTVLKETISTSGATVVT